MTHIIPISKTPLFLIITAFGEDYIQYNLDDLSTKNTICDIGVWNIKYKKWIRGN